MFRKILVAVDGSAHADAALAEAIDLAKSEHAELTVMTAVTPVPATSYVSPAAVMPGLLEAVQADAQAILRAARDQVPADLPVRTVLAEQSVRPALIREIVEGEHDLVVMGSRGRGAVRSALLRRLILRQRIRSVDGVSWVVRFDATVSRWPQMRSRCAGSTPASATAMRIARSQASRCVCAIRNGAWRAARRAGPRSFVYAAGPPQCSMR